jgi:acetoacetyl-CoA synthetase
MPLGFWNDHDGARFRAAYFERYPGVWHHGDFAVQTSRGGFAILGRSDSVLNPGGVRIGTAEIYRQVAHIAEIEECVAVGQIWEDDVRIVLFVRVQPGRSLDGELLRRIKDTIRQNTTPRHVPARILQVPDIPTTRTGKISESAVRNAVHGEPIENLSAIGNPESLEHFKNRPELAS